MENANATTLLAPFASCHDEYGPWIGFKSDGTFESFQAMPEVVEYDGGFYKRMGFSSESGTVGYRGVPRSALAAPVGRTP
jgi:hypothetical protein